MELTSPINPEIKELWCSALESEEYTQAKGRLRTADGFCCLGVLSDLAIKAGVAKWVADVKTVWVADVRTVGDGYGVSKSSGFPEQGAISGEIQSWAGIKGSSADDPLVQIGPEFCRLSSLNDRGYDFKTIAQIIREQL